MSRIYPELAVKTVIFEPDRKYLVYGGAIWFEPGRAIKPGWLLIERSRIKETGYGTEIPSEDAEVLDLGKLFIIPGMIDAHVHLGLKSSLNLIESLEQASRAGLAGVRDGGDREGRVLKDRKQIESEMILSAAGRAISRHGRYGAFLGRSVKKDTEIAGAVSELAGQGADHVKVLASGPVKLDEYGLVGPPQFETSFLEKIVSCAKDHGLKVMSHANGSEAVLRCIKAGVDSVEHGFFMGRDCLRMLGEKEVVWIPTIEAFFSLKKKTGSKKQKEIIDRTVEDQIGQMIKARELGVKMGLGTDAGSPGVKIGLSLRNEILWWLEAGFSGEEVLAAATAGNAKLMGKENDVGRLTPGRLAFLAGFPKGVSIDKILTQVPLIVGRPRL